MRKDPHKRRGLGVDRRETVDRVLAQRQPDLTVLAEALHKPRNLSAIIRTCDAVGINEVHAVPGEEGVAVHWNTSQGAEKWVGVRRHASLGLLHRIGAVRRCFVRQCVRASPGRDQQVVVQKELQAGL